MVQQKINKLTSNDDEKQDLWVLYLEDPSVDFEEKLSKIKTINQEDDAILNSILAYLQSPPTQEMLNLLDTFSDIERSILILLTLGISKEQISRYKTIETLRLSQLISNLSTHPVWGKYLDKKEIKP